MRWMFEECTNFNQDLSDWDISKVTDIKGMFAHCSSFNQDLSGWDVCQVTNMSGVFYNCYSLTHTMHWNLHSSCVFIPKRVQPFPFSCSKELKQKIVLLLKEFTLTEAINQVIANPSTNNKERYELLKFQQQEQVKELSLNYK